MQAIRINQIGDASVLDYEEVPTPEPQAGQARVRVEAAGLNFIDIYHRTGQYALSPPFTPGLEGAGVVDEVGPDVKDLKPGDRVA
jgi:NADPH:quinone reductase